MTGAGHRHLNNNEPHSVGDGSKGPLLVTYTYAAYVAIVALTTTDVQILLAKGGMNLPIVNLEVPFLGFYLIAPAILLIVQIYLFVRFFIATPVASVALAIIFWRICDYQDALLTAYHFVCFVISVILAWLARPTSIPAQAGWYSNESNGAAVLIARHAIASFIGARAPSIFTYTAWTAIALGLALKLLVFLDVTVRNWDDSLVRRLVFNYGYFVGRDGEIQDPFNLIPNLVIDRSSNLISFDRQKLETLGILYGYADWKSYFMERGITLDVRNRSLRMAFLQNQILTRTWAQDARLDGANLSFSFFAGSSMVNASLRNSNFALSDLSGAYLNHADFTHAILANTNLKGSDMEGVRLEDTLIKYSDFTGAWLSEASFRGSFFIQSKFNGAYFWDTDVAESFFEPNYFLVPTLRKGQSFFSRYRPSRNGIVGMVGSITVQADDKAVSRLFVDKFCSEGSVYGDEYAALSILRIYTIISHPVLDLFGKSVVSENKCHALSVKLGDSGARFSPRNLDRDRSGLPQ